MHIYSVVTELFLTHRRKDETILDGVLKEGKTPKKSTKKIRQRGDIS
jgi:hypothetical protein